MNTIRLWSQPILAFLTTHVWRPLNALQTKTKCVALTLFVGLGLGAYSICRSCLKERKITPLPSDQRQNGHQGSPVVPPPSSAGQPVVNQGPKSIAKPLDKMQVCYQGKGSFLGRIKEEHFQKTLGEFQTYRKDPSNQKDEQGQSNPMVVLLTHDFAQANSLGPDSEHLNMFVCYLILERVGVAYTRHGIDHYVYLDWAAVPANSARVYTTKRLLDIHQKLQALPFPSLDNYSTEERPIVEEILNDVKQFYYRRFDDHEQKVYSDVMNLNEKPLASQVMDKLVSQCPDLIYAWNADKRWMHTYLMLQLKKEDLIPDEYKNAKWSAWRNKDVVEAENEMKEDERTKVDRCSLSDRYLAFAEKLQLTRFIEELKTRAPGNRVGVFWFAENVGWVLYHLRARGDIYSYAPGDEEFKGWERSFYRIALTKEDYEADQKRQTEEAKTFQDKNSIAIPEKALKKSGLTNSQQSKMRELVEDLNRRNSWGAYSWDCEVTQKGESILRFLKDEKFIFGYEETKKTEENKYFKIYVKKQDYYGAEIRKFV